MTGSDRLRGWLGAEGLTPDELAELLGVSRSSVYSWISGRRRPGLDAALDLRDLAGIPPDAWVERGDRMGVAP